LAWPTWLASPPPLADLVADLRDLIAIPAPPFHEHERAAALRDWLAARGLPAELDQTGNVIVRWGPRTGSGKAFLAHIDTALDVGQVVLREEDGHLFGHGSADNGSGLCVLSHLAVLAWQSGVQPRQPVFFVFNVGEEGLGDLRGARGFVADHRRELDAVIALDGRLGDIVHQGIGSRRLDAGFETLGGHSWSDFGNPSAIHLLAQAIARLGDLALPVSPRTTLNVGVIQGGSAVNAIAREAHCLIDLRSEDMRELRRLERDVRAIFQDLAHMPVRFHCQCIGDRPGGAVDRDHPVVSAAAAALAEVGLTPLYTAGSTDANAALGEGIPGICCGVGRGGLAHTPDEWLDESSLVDGLEFAATLLDRLTRRA
jgi:acetylornithine deacetylase/succinyl-diaminopimelate desuccinylase-like protein